MHFVWVGSYKGFVRRWVFVRGRCVSVSKVCESVNMSVSVWKCVIVNVEVEGVCVSARSLSL